MTATPEALRGNFKFEQIELLNFVNLSPDQAEMIRTWRNSDEIRKWMYTDHVISAEEHSRYIEGLKRDSKNFWWLVTALGQPVGVLDLIKCDFRNQNAYWGFYINPTFVGKGLAYITEYSGLRMSFDIAGLNSLKLEVIGDNQPVINLHKKAGFQQEGTLRSFVAREGVFKDALVMGMLAAEWPLHRATLEEKANKVIAGLKIVA